MTVPTLAVVAIAKNEEKDMPGFLRHLVPWVDEVVIVDDDSADTTHDIVKAAGDKVRLVRRSMTDEGFSGQRNAGIDAAKSDWLLHMDIDERVPRELAEEIRVAIENTQLNAFRYRRLEFFLHRPMRGGGWQYWNRPQLARRGAHRFKNKIHEECIIEGGDGSIGQLKNKIWHLNDESYLERASKNLRYMQMSGEQIIARGIKVRWYHMLLHPAYRAFKSYFIQHGYREGTRGLMLALYTFAGIFNWWAYAWDRQNRIDRESLEDAISKSWGDRK
jgi:glycosyltransferase involved in cell wall biosynthesis